MAQSTIYRIQIQLSDVDRNVYEALDLRLAQHPSETVRYMLTRALAYALSYEEGISFSKGGLSSPDEAPISVRDPTGTLRAWIDIGQPSAERLHKAAKAAERVSIYTTTELAQLAREMANRPVHRADEIAVWKLEAAMIDALEKRLDRNTKLELTRSDGRLYVVIEGETIEGSVEHRTLETVTP